MLGPPLFGALLAGLLALAGGCGRPSSGGGTGRGVLVIAVDGLRADHLSCYGYDRETTPALDALAGEGVRFAQTFSAAPLRLPAHVPLLTGCDPNVARRRYLRDELAASVEERWLVPDKVPHLAIEMLVGGFATGAFVDHDDLGPEFGFEPGFQRFIVSDTSPTAPRREYGVEAVTDRFLQWMRSLDDSKPWFAYVHLHDLERIWSAPDPSWESYFSPREGLEVLPPVGNTDDVFFAIPRSRWRGGSRSLGYYEAMYDGHLRRLDGALERLFSTLKVQERYENTTIVVVGTHGVQFGEAGLYLTSGRYSTADVQVPWIVRSPVIPDERRGAVVNDVASLLDVPPTLLAITRLGQSSGMHGVSQLGSILSPNAAPARDYAFSSCGVMERGAVFANDWTLEYIQPDKVGTDNLRRTWFGDDRPHSDEGREIFYDRRRLAYPPLFGPTPSPPPGADDMRGAAASWEHNVGRARIALQGGTMLFDPIDPKEIAELQALGFLGDDF